MRSIDEAQREKIPMKCISWNKNNVLNVLLLRQTASNSIAHQRIYTATAKRKNTTIPSISTSCMTCCLMRVSTHNVGDLLGCWAKHNRWEQFSSCQQSPAYNQSINAGQQGFINELFLLYKPTSPSTCCVMQHVDSRARKCAVCISHDIWLRHFKANTE